MNDIPTPRTDKAIIGRDVNKASMVYAEFARTLERELVAAQKDLANLFRIHTDSLLEIITAGRPRLQSDELQEPPRRIIQISAASETEDRYQSVIALCNDGTVWRVVNRRSPADCYWASFPPIPQGKV